MKPSIGKLAICMTILFASCSLPVKKNHYSLKMKGSESMYETFLELKNDFEKNQDTVSLTIEGGGSRTGLMAIRDNEADIGLSSFPFDLAKTIGDIHEVKEKVVAYDAIVVITNQSNPLKTLTDEQMHAIYSGKVQNWMEIGGNEGHILPIIRDENSGTQKFFTEHFNIEKVTPSASTADHNADIVSKVSGNSNSIGFIGFAYFTESVNNIKLASDSTQRLFEEPTFRTIENGKYPLKRGLRIYYKDQTNPAVSGFIKYLESDRAKSIIESFGLIPN